MGAGALAVAATTSEEREGQELRGLAVSVCPAGRDALLLLLLWRRAEAWLYPELHSSAERDAQLLLLLLDPPPALRHQELLSCGDWAEHPIAPVAGENSNVWILEDKVRPVR